MLQAYVSGAAARALFVRGNDAWFVDIDDLTKKYTSSVASLPRLLGGAGDVVKLQDTTEHDALSCLVTEWRTDRALRLFDIVIDGSQAPDLRVEATIHLEELLVENEVQSRLENTLYSVPSPCPIDVALDYPQHDLVTARIISEVATHQEGIQHVREQWEHLPEDNFQSTAQRRRFELAAVTRGVFRSLALTNEADDPSALLFSCYERLLDQQNYRQVINAWTKDLKPKKKRRVLAKKAEGAEIQDSPVHPRHPEGLRSAGEKFRNVRQQQEGIVQQLRAGHVGQARRYTEQLIQFQLSNDGPAYAVKSLCALAQEAKNASQLSLQLEWLSAAVEMVPDDGWAHGQLGDAYLSLFRFEDAERSFHNASKLGQEEFAAAGNARLLRASGQLAAALNAFSIAKDKYPDSEETSYLWTGYSEVLREMGNLPAALAAYDEALERYESEVAIWCGKAATLTELGHLDDALDLYRQAIDRFPNEPTPCNGYGSTLKMRGQFSEALAVYDSAIERFPDDIFLVCGRAAALSAHGNFTAALAAYKAAIRRYSFDPSPMRGYAETLLEAGRIDEARDAYQNAVRKFPLDARSRDAYANALRSAGKFKESLVEYEKNTIDFPYDAFSLNGRARLLKELRSYTEAIAAYELLLDRLPHYEHAKYGKATVLVIFGRFDEAKQLLSPSATTTRAAWSGIRILGMIALRQKKFEEALSIFSCGERDTPFYQEKKYFRNAIALTKAALGQFQEALAAAERGGGEIAKLISLHSCLALGERSKATQFYNAVNDNATPSIINLRDVLVARYDRDRKSLTVDDASIIEYESEVFLQAA